MIYAELRREDNGDGYYCLRYLVFNGDTTGSYGARYRPDGTIYGGSRDFHRIATKDEITAYNDWRAYQAESDEVQEQMDKDGTAPDYAWHVDECEYNDDKLSICDGSSLVERITDDKRAFELAADMAEVNR